jgi:phosphoserine phosphatase
MKKPKILALFDFDGTIIRGDSTKLAFKMLYKNKFAFIRGYYLENSLGLLALIVTGDYTYLRELRRKDLVKRFEHLKSLQFAQVARDQIFESVYHKALQYVQNDIEVVIVSAGYRELIRIVLGNDFQYQIIANSLHERNPKQVNYENKVLLVGKKYEGYLVESAYGNTEGDIPMLQLAVRAFWVDENGRISEFSK